MDRPGDPHVETPGKVLTFPGPGMEAEVSAAGTTGVNAAHAMRLKQRQGAWLERAWGLLAWILAASRLSAAVKHREVFGFEDSTAFLVVVSMPLMQARRVAAAFHRVSETLHSRKRPSGHAEPEGSKPRLPGGRRQRAGKRRGRP